MATRMNRRKFLGSTAATAAAFTIVPRHVMGGPGYIPPSEKVTLGIIGFGAQTTQTPQEHPLTAAIRTGKPSSGDFTLCQPIVETFNLVAISYRLGGERLLWDSSAGRITNIPEANKYLTREYRKGWDPNLGV